MGLPKSRNWARWLLIGGALALVVGALALLWAPRPTPVDVEAVSIGPIAESVSDQGYARVREAYVVAAPISGRLERIGLHVGDRVRAGVDPVARIRPASVDLLDPRARAQAEAAAAAAGAAISAAVAERERLSAESRKAEADLGRVRTLAEKGFASRQALDSAEAQAKAAAAAVRASASQLSVRRSELAAARAALMGPDAVGVQSVTVSSPATGYVTRVMQESERTVVTGAPLVEVSDQSGLEAAVEFLSQDAVRIHEGMAAEIYDWGGSGVLSAAVRRIEPQGFTKTSALGVEEQRVLVFLQLTGPPETWARLGPGYRLWGRVFLRQTDKALKAPVGALVRKDGGWAVFRVVDGRARLTKVSVGATTEREAEVLSGLRAGDRLVVFPSDQVRDGARVRQRLSGD